MTTNVPPLVFTDTGVVVPAESAILAGVQADMNTAFGGGLNPGLQTPQGQLAQSLTAIIGDANGQIAAMASNVDPDTADGKWQNAIGRIYFLDRIPGSGSVVTATCTGAVGTPIPAGSRAQDTNGYIYAATVSVTIGPSGTVDVPFQNTTFGPIACAPGALSIIYVSIPGWDTVSNANAATLGRLVESRADFEYRRQNSVALNSVNMVQSVYANVLDVPDVIDCFVRDNPTGATVNYGATNYPLVAHSLVVSVVGGTEDDVARAIWQKKPPGCNYNGNTTVTVTDDSGYDVPVPTYEVTFLVPTDAPAFFVVNIADNPLLPANIVSLTQAAIVASFNGVDGGSRARIGSTIVAGRYYAGVSAINENVNVLSILMSLDSGSIDDTSIAFGIDQRPTITAANVTVNLV
jgi:uncharacterized phage protein gp47/JayE